MFFVHKWYSKQSLAKAMQKLCLIFERNKHLWRIEKASLADYTLFRTYMGRFTSHPDSATRFLSKLLHNLYLEKNMWATSLIFKKLSKVNNSTLGDFFNLVTLLHPKQSFFCYQISVFGCCPNKTNKVFFA
jgi:hypothetical protein